MQLFLKELLFAVLLYAIPIVIPSTECSEVADKVLGTCGRPNLPPNSRIRFTSPDKLKFSENETIYVLCQEGQFPHHVQKRTCRRGRWQGPQVRCGKAVSSNVVRLEAFHCANPNNRILSLELNQTDEKKYPLPTNSFHFTRVSVDTGLSVSGSNCSRWKVKFDRKIEIAFLLVDFGMSKASGRSKETPVINVDITHRLCKLQYTSIQEVGKDEVFGFYFFCDLKTATESDTEQYKTDFLVMDILNNKINQTVALEAIFVGEIYKKTINRNLVPDCGKVEIQTTGVIEQVELGHVLIYCNDSFVEVGAKSNRNHKFTCDWNGQWQGEWPQCTPKRTCPREQISQQLPESILIEQIGNVYHTNGTDWSAIDHSWVRYSCSNSDGGIMVGKSDRVCMAGKWSNKVPHCIESNITHAISGETWSLASLQQSLLDLRKEMQEANKKIDEAKHEIDILKQNEIIPIGFVYSQLPNEKSPNEIWPSMNWTDVSSSLEMETTRNSARVWKRTG